MQATEATEEHPNGLRQLSMTAFKAASQLVQAGRAALGHEVTDAGAAPAAADEPAKIEVTKVGRGNGASHCTGLEPLSLQQRSLRGCVHQGHEGVEAVVAVFMGDAWPV